MRSVQKWATFGIQLLFADSSYSSMTCAKCPTNLALFLSTTTMDLHRKPTVQSSVPLGIRTTLMASFGKLLLPSSIPIPSITVALNLMMSLGTTSMLQWWCWTQDLPFPEAWRPRTSPSQADIIVAWFSVDWMKWKIAAVGISVPSVFWGALCQMCTKGEAQEQGRHKSRLYSSFGGRRR